MNETVRYQIIDRATNKVIDDNALPTAFLMSNRGGRAVKRDGCWVAADYPGFKVAPTDVVYVVTIREAF